MSYQANEKRYDTMTYRHAGSSGLCLPAVSLGLWHNFGGAATRERMQALCFTAFDAGITHFDLANNYGPPPGSAEENFGRILKEDKEVCSFPQVLTADKYLQLRYTKRLQPILRQCITDCQVTQADIRCILQVFGLSLTATT